MVEEKEIVTEEKTGEPKKESRYMIATNGKRTVAGLIDFAIFIVLTNLMMLWVSPAVNGWFEGSSAQKIMYFSTLISSLPIAVIVYFIPTLFFKNGKTLGKYIMHLQVIRKHGVPVDNMFMFFRTIIGFYVFEYFTEVFMGGIPVFLILSAIFIFIDKRRRAFHDLIASTLVVEDEKEEFKVVKYKTKKEIKEEIAKSRPTDVRIK